MVKKRFIVIEGFDGAGKTDTSKWLAEKCNYTYIKSPTGVFADARDSFDNLNKATIRERFFYYLAVSMSSSATAKDILSEDRNILFDRYIYSTLVYHEILSPGMTDEYKHHFRSLMVPDLVIYLFTDYDIALERMNKRKNCANDDLFFNRDRHKKASILYPKFLKEIPATQVIEVKNNGTFKELTDSLREILGR